MTMQENECTSGVPDAEIRAVFKDEHEVQRVKEILAKLARQTAGKEIPPARQISGLTRLKSKLFIMFHYGLHWSKPLYPFRLLRNILLSRLYRLLGSNRHVLAGCEFDITFNCNFNCSHCSIARLKEDGRRQELTLTEYKDVVRQAMALGAISFGIEGGEPFVKKDWDKVIETFMPHYNHVLISSNGYLFDEEKARRCAELGVDTINFSLDSSIPEVHDLFRRKKGSHAKVLHAIELCRKYKIKVIINTVVHRHNLYTEGFRDLLAFGEENKILIHVLFAKSIGNYKDNDSMLSDEDIKAYREISKSYPFAFVHHDTDIAQEAKGCNGTKEMLQFTPYGDVMNCANLHIYFGNVRSEPLQQIRERALRETPFSKFRPCFLTMDKDFMAVYYPLLERKPYITIDEFRSALTEYEKKHGRVVYPELHSS